jgi:hypothetical protein
MPFFIVRYVPTGGGSLPRTVRIVVVMTPFESRDRAEHIAASTANRDDAWQVMEAPSAKDAIRWAQRAGGSVNSQDE